MLHVRKLLAVLLLLPGLVWAECDGTQEQQVACFVADDLATPPTLQKTLLVGDSYVKLYDSAATDMAPAFLTRRGVSGLRAENLYTYRNELILAHSPRRVFMWIGQNDIHNGASAATVNTRIQSIVTAIHAVLPQTQVYILSIPPSPIRSCQHVSPDPDCLTNSYPDEFNERPIQEAANTLLQTYAAATANVEFINVNAGLFSSYPTLNTSLYSAVDELHLKVGGVAYAAIGDILGPLANAALPTAGKVAVVRCWLPNGPYVPAASVVTKCPPLLVGGSTNTVLPTSYNISVTTNKSSGTIYAYTSTSATPPNRTAHKNGTGAVHHGTIAVSASGVQTRAVTGGTADTQYYTYLLHEVSGRPSNRITIPQRTAAGSPPASTPVAGYFWGTGGSDFNAGTSAGAKFASIQPIQSLSGVATGTDIWGLQGSVHTVTSKGKISTKWHGSIGNPVIWGCYYLDGGNPTACTEGSAGSTLDLTSPNALTENTAGSNALPQVLGAKSNACLDAKNCDWEFPVANECSSIDDQLVRVYHDYQDFWGFRISNSSCRGMTVWDGSIGVTDGSLTGFRFRGSVVERSGRHSILLFSGIKYSLIQDNIFRLNQACSRSRYHGGTYPSAASADLSSNRCQNPTSSIILQTSLNSYSGFSNNTLIFEYAENVHCLNSMHVLMRGNRIYNGLKPMYSDACGNTIVERNLITPHNQNSGFGPGTSTAYYWNGLYDFNAEFNQWQLTPAPTNELVRANIFIGGGRCLSAGLSSSAVAGGEKISGKFYHNTCIATRGSNVVAGNNLTAAVNDGIDFKNNVFAGPTATDADICSADTTGNYNVYAKQPAVACRGANDINSSAATDTLLTLPVGTSGSPNNANIDAWRTSDYDNPPNIENARPTAGTLTGTRLNNVQCISDAEVTEWQHILDWIGGINTATWKMCAPEYFDGAAIPNTPILGALKN